MGGLKAYYLPICPHCYSRDYMEKIGEKYFCKRCGVWVELNAEEEKLIAYP